MTLREVIIRNDGVVTAAQALACGLSRSAIDRRVASGE
ncbi:type IV toxin-antitoxin system AbiEi family antitoxin domain-containing protein [Gordonia sp. NPDC003424]